MCVFVVLGIYRVTANNIIPYRERFQWTKTEAPAYAANRKQAAHVLNKLSAEYMVKEKEKKAKAVSGKKRDLPEPDDSSDPPTDSDEDEDDDE